MLALAVLACKPAADPREDPPGTVFVTETGIPRGDTGGTDPSVTTPPTTPIDEVDCTVPLPDQVPYTLIDITTEEDFDFDLRGYLYYQSGSDIVGSKPGGVFTVIAAGVSTDASGMQTLSNGDLIVASPDYGNIKYVFRESGVNNQLIGGLTSPNGIEIGPLDVVFFSETYGNRVRWIDPATGDQGQIADDLEQPNGLSFSPDANTLYVTANGSVGDGIVKYVWDGATYVYGGLLLAGEGNEYFDGVETDVCGNVYSVDFNTGRLFRVPPDGLSHQVLADIDGSGSFAALKWGNGIEGWSRSTLYVTNRNNIYAFEMGIEGTPDVLPVP